MPRMAQIYVRYKLIKIGQDEWRILKKLITLLNKEAGINRMGLRDGNDLA